MGFGVIDSAFIVSGEAAGLVKPAEGALDDPTLAYELETLGGVASRDDIQAEFAKGTQTLDPFEQGTQTATVCPDDLQSGKEQVEVGEKLDGAIPVLDGGGSHADAQNHAKGVHQQVSLAPAYLLAGVVANGFAALFGALDALAVENGRGWGGFSTFPNTDLLPQAMVELLPQATLAPGRKVIEHRGLGWKVLGQHAPLAATSIHEEDGVEDFSPAVLDGSSADLGLWNQWLDDVPFLVAEIARIGLGCVHPKLAV